MTYKEKLVNDLRSKVANAICDRTISWQECYDAMIAMKWFDNWDIEDFYDGRPVDEGLIKEYVVEWRDRHR